MGKLDKSFYTTVRYRNPEGIDIIDDFLLLTLNMQHDGLKQRGLMSLIMTDVCRLCCMVCTTACIINNLLRNCDCHSFSKL